MEPFPIQTVYLSGVFLALSILALILAVEVKFPNRWKTRLYDAANAGLWTASLGQCLILMVFMCYEP